MNKNINLVQVAADRGGLCYKDALYFSCHKLVGGVETPGVLVVKKALAAGRPPNCPGGGTVFYVTDSDHRCEGVRVWCEEGVV